MQRFERGTIESRADATDITPTLALMHCTPQRATASPCPALSGETHDHRLLALARLHLQPFACASAGIIEPARELRHDAFLMGALGAVEGGDAFANHISAVLKQGILRERSLERLLALEQGATTEVFAPDIKQVEDAVTQSGRLALGILQQLKARASLIVERHELAVKDCYIRCGAQRLADRRIFARDVEAVARVERGFSPFHQRHYTESVPFRFEDPSGVIKDLVR